MPNAPVGRYHFITEPVSATRTAACARPVRVAVAVDVPARGDVVAGALAGFPDVEVVPLTADDGAPSPDVIVALAPVGAFGVAAVVEQVMGRIGGLAPVPAVVAAALDVDTADARRALAAGARGYLTIVDGLHALQEAVRAVADGRSWVSPSIGVALAQEDALAETAGLDARERDVLRLLAFGYTNAEAAAELCFSVRTIESVRSAICQRLGLASRRELVAMAMDLGLMRDRAA